MVQSWEHWTKQPEMNTAGGLGNNKCRNQSERRCLVLVKGAADNTLDKLVLFAVVIITTSANTSSLLPCLPLGAVGV